MRPSHPAVGLVGGVEQGADDDAAEGRGGLQHAERDLHEDGQPAPGELSRCGSVSPETRSA